MVRFPPGGSRPRPLHGDNENRCRPWARLWALLPARHLAATPDTKGSGAQPTARKMATKMQRASIFRFVSFRFVSFRFFSFLFFSFLFFSFFVFKRGELGKRRNGKTRPFSSGFWKRCRRNKSTHLTTSRLKAVAPQNQKISGSNLLPSLLPSLPPPPSLPHHNKIKSNKKRKRDKLNKNKTQKKRNDNYSRLSRATAVERSVG